ncbi:hypothetical protein NQZ68_030740 [Dissostichus eleginoides]|nr:hypothetical protein NQZ68_030740 [Dissostichus eleginoides]
MPACFIALSASLPIATERYHLSPREGGEGGEQTKQVRQHLLRNPSIPTKRFRVYESPQVTRKKKSFDHQHLSRAAEEASVWQMCCSNNGSVSICTRLPACPVAMQADPS